MRLEVPPVQTALKGVPSLKDIADASNQLYGSWITGKRLRQIYPILSSDNTNGYPDDGTNYGIVGTLTLNQKAVIKSIYYSNADIENNAISLLIDGQPYSWLHLLGILSSPFPENYFSIGRVLTALYTSSVTSVVNVNLGNVLLVGNPSAPQGSAAGSAGKGLPGLAVIYTELIAYKSISVALDTINTTGGSPPVTVLGLPYVTIDYELVFE
jgi:hypothetical protein